MKKTLHLALSQYEPIPLSLQGANAEEAKQVIELDVASLYHHYYQDSYETAPPDPNPALFEHTSFLMPGVEFRFQANGLGASTNAKRNRSSELGQAFCRWFLYEHLGLKYFAHMDSMVGASRSDLHGYTVERAAPGDMPDYLCSDGAGTVVLAEAKGRYTSVSFKSKEFSSWRQQFTRVRVLDARKKPVRVKGHIVATRFATEYQSAIQTKLYAEDPSTEGQEPISMDTAALLSRHVAASHYADVLVKLDQPLLAHAIRRSIRLDDLLGIPVTIWRFAFGDFEHEFVGGYYARDTAQPLIDFKDGHISRRSSDPFRLGVHSGTFVGLDLSVFKRLVDAARNNRPLGDLPEIEPLRDVYSGLSMLRDGSVIGPLQMFIPDRFARF
ncbi:hypothetical protein SAMN03159304_03119 [Pseudomonas sp. NFACC24-1]|uniref:hypothetical protein n=1 Tax=Pseudomonas sp. NFACC24-1 TaxID=1566189 RepID=UPI0008F3C9D0|nr:hypothetical protein [Pseudomonas sp. NFACC24-1]SFO39836.1 hypothetical protein SAMN03159304_03119 [Pseudomonas sp. NFACC24-1]